MAWKRRPLPQPTQRSDDAQQARQRALGWLTDRDFSSNGLYEKLRRTYTDQAAAQVVAEMVQLQYVDDERYARNLVRSLYGQHRSRRFIAGKLAEKGVERSLAARILDEVYEQWQQELTEEAEYYPDESAVTDPETAAALALIEKSYQRKLQDGRPDLVLAALQRRGFSYRAAKAALAAAQTQL